jgi:hypothetical protein
MLGKTAAISHRYELTDTLANQTTTGTLDGVPGA